MNGPCSTMYIAPRHIIVAASDRAECTALRSATMPMPPASAMGPRIQNATASPSGTCPFMSGPDASIELIERNPQRDERSREEPRRRGAARDEGAVRICVGPRACEWVHKQIRERRDRSASPARQPLAVEDDDALAFEAQPAP